MFASAVSGSARIVGLALILVAAAVLGLTVGTIINERGGEARTVAGYPPGWNGGAAIPVSRTATALFSADALESVKVTRGDVAAPVAPAEESDDLTLHPQFREKSAPETFSTQDYADQHQTDSAPAAEESDYHDRHSQEQAADPLPGIPWSEDPRR